jgi:hypothetical protein
MSSSIFQWEIDYAAACARVKQNRSPFKIVLKIKDDSFFLQRWIDHHAKIVGLENLIILDNMSDDPKVIEVYAKVADVACIIRFTGFHNRVHRVEDFEPLYRALQYSSEYFQFLDADEKLVYVDNDLNVFSDYKIVDSLLASGANVLPGSWLENVSESENLLWWDLKQNHPFSCLRSGKPIISSRANIKGMINHNHQLAVNLYDQNVKTNFLVLHYKRLSAKQRIESNFRKLLAYNAFKGRQTTVEDVLVCNWQEMPPGNKRNWIKEIQSLSNQATRPTERARLLDGMVELCDACLQFSSEGQRSMFIAMLHQPVSHVKQALE